MANDPNEPQNQEGDDLLEQASGGAADPFGTINVGPGGTNPNP
jgi:hypothetical protein